MVDKGFEWWYNNRVKVMLHMYHDMHYNLDEIGYIMKAAPKVVSEMLDIPITRDYNDEIVDKRES